MDIWDELYGKAAFEYEPKEVNPFIYTNHVVAALEAVDGKIYSGYCIEGTCGTMNLCAERVAALNMYIATKDTKIRRLIAFRDNPPFENSGMPCGICREFLMQLDRDNRDMEIMLDYESKKTVTLGELMPNWWGDMRYNMD